MQIFVPNFCSFWTASPTCSSIAAMVKSASRLPVMIGSRMGSRKSLLVFLAPWTWTEEIVTGKVWLDESWEGECQSAGPGAGVIGG